MNKQILSKTPIVFAVVGLMLAVSGCQIVARENIISAVNTGIGITVAENPKTELYEVKVGYIRSQYYSVPTGKIVKNEKETDGETNNGKKDMRSNEANKTPQVVSGIKMSSGIQHLLVGMDVSENFAVGEIAVNSPAAVAMYVAEAKDAATANSAATAASNVSKAALKAVEAKEIDSATKSKEIEDYVAPNGTLDKVRLTGLAKGTNAENDVVNINSLEKLKEFLKGSLDIDDLYKKIPQSTTD